MPIYRTNFSQQSIYKKLLGYVGAMRYARKRFGVLIVTISPTRAFYMVGILRPKLQHLEGDTYKNLILFTHEAQLHHDPLHWTNLVGESASLLPEKP
jgi:hypothetical protein